MKTILYSLIAVLLLGSIAPGFIKRENLTSNIIVQSEDTQVSVADLAQSAKIISERLDGFSSEKSEVNVVPEKNQILVSLSGNWDMSIAEQLILQKGKLSFYESYTLKEVMDLMSDDGKLASLLNKDNYNFQEFKLGCVSVEEVMKINDYLGTVETNRPCRFVWTPYSLCSEACLYAIRSAGEKDALVTNADLESIKSVPDKSSSGYSIEIRLLPEAADKWAKATNRNINKVILIVLDDSVLFAPVVKSEIKSGICSITGNFTETEAGLIEALAGNGILPVDLKIIK
jgi:preprotein translocase subunit SecD